MKFSLTLPRLCRSIPWNLWMNRSLKIKFPYQNTLKPTWLPNILLWTFNMTTKLSNRTDASTGIFNQSIRSRANTKHSHLTLCAFQIIWLPSSLWVIYCLRENNNLNFARTLLVLNRVPEVERSNRWWTLFISFFSNLTSRVTIFHWVTQNDRLCFVSNVYESEIFIARKSKPSEYIWLLKIYVAIFDSIKISNTCSEEQQSLFAFSFCRLINIQVEIFNIYCSNKYLPHQIKL